MARVRILVAEDDTHLRQGVVDLFEAEGYEVVSAADGLQALDLYRQQRPDLILLDIMMPGKSGFDVCREIRREDARLPIIMLTAKGEEVDKVVGLELGADDYVTKPFGVHELRARVAAVMRRSFLPAEGDGEQLPDRIRIGCAEVDRTSYQGETEGRPFSLTAREMKIIEAFYRHPGRVLSRDELLNLAWGIEYQGTTRTLDQHISQLRKKIERDPAAPEVITTVHGVGYLYRV